MGYSIDYQRVRGVTGTPENIFRTAYDQWFDEFGDSENLPALDDLDSGPAKLHPMTTPSKRGETADRLRPTREQSPVIPVCSVEDVVLTERTEKVEVSGDLISRLYGRVLPAREELFRILTKKFGPTVKKFTVDSLPSRGEPFVKETEGELALKYHVVALRHEHPTNDIVVSGLDSEDDAIQHALDIMNNAEPMYTNIVGCEVRATVGREDGNKALFSAARPYIGDGVVEVTITFETVREGAEPDYYDVGFGYHI